jgi:hypothetical protein
MCLRHLLHPALAGALFACLLPVCGHAQGVAPETHDPSPPGGNGALASRKRPHVPEPMFFDLVRPLGARKGELEVNVLGHSELDAGHFAWAPEIEYAFRDGLAVEFELPFEGSHLEEYKFALQGTLGHFAGERAIHGWQTIGRLGRGTAADSVDVLYVLGMNGDWPMLHMAGVRRDVRGGTRTVGIVNSSVFHGLGAHSTLGIEVNLEIEEGFSTRARVLPQVHHDLHRHLTLQLGAGPSWLEGNRRPEPLVSGRLIYVF